MKYFKLEFPEKAHFFSLTHTMFMFVHTYNKINERIVLNRFFFYFWEQQQHKKREKRMSTIIHLYTLISEMMMMMADVDTDDGCGCCCCCCYCCWRCYWKLFMLPHDWVFRIKIEAETSLKIVIVLLRLHTTTIANGGCSRGGKKRCEREEKKWIPWTWR